MGGSRPAGYQAKLNVRPGRPDWPSATLVAVGAALLLLLLGVGAVLLLLLVADGRGAALHLAAAGAESQQYDTHAQLKYHFLLISMH